MRLFGFIIRIDHDARSPERQITYYECVFLALGMQHAILMRHIVTCGLTVCTIFLRIVSETVQLLQKKLLNLKCVSIFCTAFF